MFDDAKIKVNKSDRTFFEIEELIKWNDLKFPPKEKNLGKKIEIFTFQNYTGFYFQDLKILKKSDIWIDKEVGIFVVGKRDKNGDTAIIPLYKFPNVNRILTRYASKDDDDFLFDETIFIEDQVYNRQLKTIAERVQPSVIHSTKIGLSNLKDRFRLHLQGKHKIEVLNKNGWFEGSIWVF